MIAVPASRFLLYPCAFPSTHCSCTFCSTVSLRLNYRRSDVRVVRTTSHSGRKISMLGAMYGHGYRIFPSSRPEREARSGETFSPR